MDLIIGEYLFKTYPDMAEGNLTKIKAATVCEDSLASVSRSLQLGQYLLLGHGERASGGNDRNSILADTFESLIGAIYISTDYQTAMAFVLKHLTTYIMQALEGKRGKDYKTLLQEYSSSIIIISSKLITFFPIAIALRNFKCPLVNLSAAFIKCFNVL